MIQSASLPGAPLNAYKDPYSRTVGDGAGTGASFAGQPHLHTSQYHGQIGRSLSAHMQQTGQSFQFSSVPTPRFPPPQSQSQSQQAVRLSATPPAGTSPHEGQRQPMAVPPTNVGQQQPQSGPKTAVSSHFAQSPTPSSPGTQNREQQRIELLLEINSELLQEINRLQADGQGGATSQQQLQQLRSEGLPEKQASELYMGTMLRVQANLAWLMPKASSSPNVPLGPPIMTPPPQMTTLVPLYERLKGLFPDWHGIDGRKPASSYSPRPNGPTAPSAGSPQ